MSHVVVSVATLSTGGLVIGGLIVAGLIIGKIAIHHANKVKEAEENMAAETFSANKADLFAEFSKATEMVLEEINALNEEYKDDLSKEISLLNALPGKLLDNYSLDVYKSDEHEIFLNFTLTEFNNKILQIKEKVEETKLEIYESQKLNNIKIIDLEDILENINEVPAGFSGEHQELTKSLGKLQGVTSLKEKAKLLSQLESQFQDFNSALSLSNDVDSENLREEQINMDEAPDQSAKIRKEIKLFHEKLNLFDQEIYNELKAIVEEAFSIKYSQRMDLIRDQVKLKYGKIKEQTAQTNIYRQNLGKLMLILPEFAGSGEIIMQVVLLLQQKYINRSSFAEISRRITDFISHAKTEELNKSLKQELVAKVRVSLENLGYNIVDGEAKNEINRKLENGEIVYIDTEWQDYQVMLKVSEDSQITTRLVKVVATETEKENISTYQKQKDAEVSKKWCNHYDLFLDEMRKSGVNISTKIRKETEEEELLYIVNKELAVRQNNAAKQVNNKDKEMSI